MAKLLKIAFASSLALATATASYASPLVVNFTRITNNGNENVSAQLLAEISDEGTDQQSGASLVGFKFFNNVGIASSITDIYFDDGTLFGISSISTSGAGVAFSAPANPGNLPGGNGADPDFVTTQNFSLDSNAGNPGVSANGVNAAGEWVMVTFALINGQTYADTIAAFNLGGAEGGLRIGLHVQSIGTQGGSDSYINDGRPPRPKDSVPDGGMTATLLGLALAGMGVAARRLR